MTSHVVREESDLDIGWIDLHCGCDRRQYPSQRSFRSVIGVRRIFRDRQHDMCLQEPVGSKQTD